jgi:cytochrome c-type biogenesis protein CcmH
MMSFVLLAAVLTTAVILGVVTPLLRRSASGVAPAAWTALGAAGVLFAGSAVLYGIWSNWAWRAPPPADSPQSMVARLARQLEHDPTNLQGWLMLGRSYTVLQEYPLAVRAFQRADRLSGGKNAEALTGEAEALALGDESELDNRAARLIEQALAIAPNSGQALFLGGAIAERHGDLALARARFAKLLELNPPPNVRPMIEQQIVSIDERLAGGGTGGAAAQHLPATQQPGAPLVHVNVTVAPAVAGAARDAPLFVFVRDPSGGGPPLAVKRLESHFPQDIALSPSDSMIPGRAFTNGQSVQVVARVARSGNPVGASGDPFGEVIYRVGHDGVVSLVIDRLTP